MQAYAFSRHVTHHRTEDDHELHDCFIMLEECKHPDDRKAACQSYMSNPLNTHIHLQAAGEALEKVQPAGIDVLINNAGKVFCMLMCLLSVVTIHAAYGAGLM